MRNGSEASGATIVRYGPHGCFAAAPHDMVPAQTNCAEMAIDNSQGTRYTGVATNVVVTVAQSAELWIVAPAVVGSSPIGHPRITEARSYDIGKIAPPYIAQVCPSQWNSGWIISLGLFKALRFPDATLPYAARSTALWPYLNPLPAWASRVALIWIISMWEANLSVSTNAKICRREMDERLDRRATNSATI